MTTTLKEAKKRTIKETELSETATKWCRKTASVAAKRAFRVKSLSSLLNSFDSGKLRFFLLPKIFHRTRVSNVVKFNDGSVKVYLHPDFFDEKGNIRRKLPRTEREELKAAIYKEVAHLAFNHTRTNLEFFKVMVRCPWKGTRVVGAVGSETEARQYLSKRKQRKKAQKRTIVEEATGLKEDVWMWDLTSGQRVLVKNADIFLADGKIKIARGTHNGKKLRTMLPGGAALKAKLG